MSKNILFIMCDQLRFDYLGCTGHPHIKTPNIDALAERGVRFDRAYVQSPICGPSRMSFYTGRYVRSHGSTWNSAPLRVGELNIGDHLNPLGMRTVLCGKTHMAADRQGLERVGVDPDSDIGQKISECGFEVWDRLDGLYPSRGNRKRPAYESYLKSRGYSGENPWEDFAASVEDEDGTIRSGWLWGASAKPARVRREDSETVYSTNRAIAFIDGADDQPWCLHLSYIKPHWPYVAPAPYNDMYGPEDMVPVVRDDCEKEDAHPLLTAFQAGRSSSVYNRPGARETIITGYMGLISQIDDEIGRLVRWLDDTDRLDNTVIVFTSDHGDYLGDHWLGEKELFHDASARIPLIIVDPSARADATRGTVCEALVEAIDLLPTFVDIAGGDPAPHILEGQSLMPLLHDANADWARDVVISEYDYAFRLARTRLGRGYRNSTTQMIFDGRWKMVRVPGFPPILHDLENDPQELRDLGRQMEYQPVIDRLNARLLDWATEHHSSVTQPAEFVERTAGGEYHSGVLIGFWDEADAAEAERLGHGGN